MIIEINLTKTVSLQRGTVFNKQMKKIHTIILLILPIIANCQYRFSFKMANINSSAYFEKTDNTFYYDNDPNTLSDNDYAYRINAQNTMDWPQSEGTSFLTDIGRRFAMELGIEKKINDQFSISSGFEVGARYFSVDQIYNYSGGQSVLDLPLVYRSYRNFSVTFNVAYNQRIKGGLSLKPSLGFSINMPESYSQKNYIDTYESRAFSPIYFMLTFGAELNYTFKKGNEIAISAIYSQGFTNVIKDYVGDQRRTKDTVGIENGKWLIIDNYYSNKVSVASNGTNFSLGIKYYFLPFGKEVKQRKNTTINPETMDFSKRLLNKTTDVLVDTNYVKLCVWDDQRIDGDSIAIEYKDSIIFNNVRLDATKKCIWIKVERNQPNYLIVHALNEGRVKPNTVSLVVYGREKEIPISIKTDLSKSGNINIRVE